MAEAKAERRTKRCVIYCRVSSEEQARGQYSSVEAQEDRCKHAIAMKEDQGWVHTTTVKDPGFSGKDMNRPGIQDLIRRVRANEVDVVLTYRIDRVSRSILAFYDFYADLQKHGVELFSLTESFDTSTTVGRLMLNIILSFAQYERELTQERTQHKMQNHAEHGRWNGGLVPFGYELDLGAPKGERKLGIKRHEADVVERIFERYRHLQNVTAVCHELADRGVLSRTRTLRQRDGSTRQIGGLPFYKTRVFDILRNPIYTGRIRYGDKVYPGQHPAIISMKEFESVQRLLDQNSRQSLVTTRDEQVHLLKGLLRCGTCHTALTPYPSGKKDPKTGLPYLYYCCTASVHHNRKEPCPLPLLPARPFEATIKAFLRAVCQNSTTLAQAIKDASRDSSTTLAPLRKTQGRLVAERKALSTRITNYLDAIGRHGVKGPEIKDELQAATSRRDAIDREMEQLMSEIATGEHQVLNLETIRENLRAFESLIDKLSVEDQKKLCQLFIRRITVWPHEAKTKTPPEEKGVFLTPLPAGKGRKRDRVYRVQVDLHQLPGLDRPTATELAKFGFSNERLPGEDSNLQHTG